MIREEYKQQVRLLLSILPEIAKEDCFALHGGTAINLFVRNMPRLSVDVDLTYLPIEDYETSKTNINLALKRILANIQKVLTGAKIGHDEKTCKLNINNQDVSILVEVNLVNRGSLYKPVIAELCTKAQEEFEVSVRMKILPHGLLFGGKICAALDRQHPRDIFDIQYLLNSEGITDEVKEGFLFYLTCHNRPISEMLSPNWQDQKSAMENSFTGMSVDSFSYDDYENVREILLRTLLEKLTDNDKRFLLSIKKLDPIWSTNNFEPYPGVRWKLLNLQTIREKNKEKYQEMVEKLQLLLFPVK